MGGKRQVVPTVSPERSELSDGSSSCERGHSCYLEVVGGPVRSGESSREQGDRTAKRKSCDRDLSVGKNKSTTGIDGDIV